jgi:hypothetical protein
MRNTKEDRLRQNEVQISAFNPPKDGEQSEGCILPNRIGRLPWIPISRSKQSDALYWILALIFGAVAGFTHVCLNDSGLSVLMVTGFTMFLAYQRPQRIWWWAAIVGLSLPVGVLLTYLIREKPSLGMVAGSFAGLAFAVVAAVGGKVLRRVVAELFPPKSPPAQN